MKYTKPILANKLKPYVPHILLVTSVVTIASVFIFLDPIAQNTCYHAFANETSLFGIPNVANVVSNVGFVFVGILGFITSFKRQQFNAISIVLLAGIFLTGFGSGYYHYTPNNITLVWDRIPMTIIFSSYFALILSVYFSEKSARMVWLINLAIGIFSVIYWQYTESLGRGDLRWYALVQFLPMLLIFILLILERNEKRILKSILNVMVWYILAKLFEHFDHQIHEITGFVSGHPLKHLAASVATYYMLPLLKDTSQ